VNEFLDAILTSVDVAVVVLDAELHVQVWNRRAEDLWGVRSDEAIGHAFLNLDIGLPLEYVRNQVLTSIADATPSVQMATATNRRGRTIGCRISASPFRTSAEKGSIILMMEEVVDRNE